MHRSLFLSLTSLSMAACYGSAPPHPAAIKLPELSDEAVMNVYSESRTVMETHPKEERICPANITDHNSKECTVIIRQITEPVVHTDTTATYGAGRINYAQFRVLTDPEYNAKVARLDDMRSKCTRANVPRYIGTALVLGGLVTAIASEGKETVGYIGLGAIGGGFASYLFGYYGFGGRTCNQAAALFDKLDLEEEETWKTAKGENRAAEMKVLADQFNSTRRAHGEAPAVGETPPSPPTTAPSPATPPTPVAPQPTSMNRVGHPVVHLRSRHA